MLQNGAETYRVEDTIMRICQIYHIPYVESFVTPTGIFVSADDGKNDQEAISFIKRIKSRTIDLNKVAKVNDFSRKLATNYVSLEDGMKMLKEIDQLPKYNKFLKILCAGMASAFFGVLLQASFYDTISSFVIAILVYLTASFFDKINSNLFIQNLFGGATASLLAIFSVAIGFGVHLDKIIISSIMILLPGVAITNAVRDSISGDLLSGVSRSAEAVIIAISIAVGVGIIMNTWIHIFGGLI